MNPTLFDACVLRLAQEIAYQRANAHNLDYEGWSRASVVLQRQCLEHAVSVLEALRPVSNTSSKVIGMIAPTVSYGVSRVS